MAACKFLASLVLIASFAAAKAQVDYWPFKVGNTWTMPTKAGGNTIVQVITVKSVTVDNGVTTATLDYSVNGKSVQTEIYRVDKQGMSRVAAGLDALGKVEPALPVIMLPLTAGKSWNWEGTITNGGTKIPGKGTLTVSGPEMVKTDAGTFSAMKVHLVLTVSAGGQSLTIPNDYWFAPGVGLVKQSAVVNGITIEGAISSYSVKN